MSGSRVVPSLSSHCPHVRVWQETKVPRRCWTFSTQAISHLVGTQLFQTFQYITVNSSPGYGIWDVAGSSWPPSILSRHFILTLTNHISLQTRSGLRRVTLMLAGPGRRPWCSPGHTRGLTRTGSSLCPPDSSSRDRGQAPANQSKLRSGDSGPRMRGQ